MTYRFDLRVASRTQGTCPIRSDCEDLVGHDLAGPVSFKNGAFVAAGDKCASQQSLTSLSI